MGNQKAIDNLAAHQHGVFSIAQCAAAGFDKGAIRRRRDSGNWVRLAPTVYAVRSSPPNWERALAAAVLSRPTAYVGGTAAAHLHQVLGSKRSRPVIVAPETSNARSELAQVIRHRRFDQIDTLHVSGFRTTSVEETVVFLARRYDKNRLYRSLTIS